MESIYRSADAGRFMLKKIKLAEYIPDGGLFLTAAIVEEPPDFLNICCK